MSDEFEIKVRILDGDRLMIDVESDEVRSQRAIPSQKRLGGHP